MYIRVYTIIHTWFFVDYLLFFKVKFYLLFCQLFILTQQKHRALPCSLDELRRHIMKTYYHFFSPSQCRRTLCEGAPML